MKRMTFNFDSGFSFTAIGTHPVAFHRYIRMRLLACQVASLGFYYITL